MLMGCVLLRMYSALRTVPHSASSIASSPVFGMFVHARGYPKTGVPKTALRSSIAEPEADEDSRAPPPGFSIQKHPFQLSVIPKITRGEILCRGSV
jgi:hypothetical protein